MSFSMYDLTVPVMLRNLGILSEYMDKAAAYAVEKKIEPSVLINARLAPDMFPLAGQIQRFSDNCKGGVAKLADIPTPRFPDTEATFGELKERLTKTANFLQDIKPELLNGDVNRLIEIKVHQETISLSARTYLLSMVLPNIFFHLTTTHNILRHCGMNVGKMDYLGYAN
ncbi:DUF1993 domain-containing protein [Legionella saoudiensis]|uniref:DUF1993 domain-containing protein n=1 Tax=Legionella saoudiensis TaxID=1750561 RepID=UPI000730F72B|nr:DUF1993 domain-containing protein [Legionella saoudiensis]